MTESERITRLEVQHVERWDAHDKHAEERQTALCRKMDEIRNDIKELYNAIESKPCGVHEERLKGINSRLVWLWSIFSGLALAVAGIWLNDLMK